MNGLTRCCAGLVVSVVALALAACSGPGELAEKTYNADRGVTVYESDPISFSNSRLQSGLGKNRSLIMEARASCQGRDCVPNEVSLIFSTSSNSSIFLTDRSISLSTGDETYEWEEQRDTDTFEGETIIGQISRVQISLEQLRDIAAARTVNCSIGGSPFQLSFEDRRPLRQLTEKFGQSTEGASS